MKSKIFKLKKKSFHISKRFYIIAKPLEMKNITFEKTGIIISGCLIYTLILTISPLIGWSYYSLESSLIQCGVEWAEIACTI